MKEAEKNGVLFNATKKSYVMVARSLESLISYNRNINNSFSQKSCFKAKYYLI
jgi:hypothetical protein